MSDDEDDDGELVHLAHNKRRVAIEYETEMEAFGVQIKEAKLAHVELYTERLLPNCEQFTVECSERKNISEEQSL